MRAERLAAELVLLHREFPNATIDLPDGTELIIEDFALPPGWNAAHTTLLVQLPPAYPTTPPDNFYVEPTLLLTSNAPPANTSAVDIDGSSWLQFSWHIEPTDWKIHADIARSHTLVDYVAAAITRLEEGL